MRNTNHLRAYYRERYHKRVAAGMCGICGKVPPRDGRTACVECGRKHAERTNRRQQTINPILAEFGLCRYCRVRESMPNANVCGACQEWRTEQSAEYRARRIAARKCIDCGAPVVPGKQRCAEHLARHARLQREYRAKKRMRVAA